MVVESYCCLGGAVSTQRPQFVIVFLFWDQKTEAQAFYRDIRTLLGFSIRVFFMGYPYPHSCLCAFLGALLMMVSGALRSSCLPEQARALLRAKVHGSHNTLSEHTS